MRTWQLQVAENRFCEVIDAAVTNGPQVIMQRGVEIAVVLSYAEHRRLVVGQGNLSGFFRGSPLAETPLDLCRDQSSPRSGPTL